MRLVENQLVVGATVITATELVFDEGLMQPAPRTAHKICTTFAAFTGVTRTHDVRVERARALLQLHQTIFWRLHLPCATPIDGALAAQELAP